MSFGGIEKGENYTLRFEKYNTQVIFRHKERARICRLAILSNITESSASAHREMVRITNQHDAIKNFTIHQN